MSDETATSKQHQHLLISRLLTRLGNIMAAGSHQEVLDARAPKSQKQIPNFTVFVRLPFPRGDFVDPPPVSRQPHPDICSQYKSYNG